MTPSSWQLDHFALWGALWMFGGAIVSVGVGALIARWRSVELGIGVGMLMWGLGNLATAIAVAVFVYIDSTVLVLTQSRCEPLPPRDDGKPIQQLFFRLDTMAPAGAATGTAARTPAASTPAREVFLDPQGGVCAEDLPLQTLPIRVRQADVAGVGRVIRGDEVDEDKPLAIMVTWGLFGGVGTLIGIVMLTLARPGRAATKAGPRQPVEVAPWRKSLGNQLSLLGLLVMLAAFVGPFLLDGSTERALQFGLRAGAAAVGCWLLASFTAGMLTLSASFGFALFIGVLAGLAELVKRSA